MNKFYLLLCVLFICGCTTWGTYSMDQCGPYPTNYREIANRFAPRVGQMMNGRNSSTQLRWWCESVTTPTLSGVKDHPGWFVSAQVLGDDPKLGIIVHRTARISFNTQSDWSLRYDLAYGTAVDKNNSSGPYIAQVVNFVIYNGKIVWNSSQEHGMPNDEKDWMKVPIN